MYWSTSSELFKVLLWFTGLPCLVDGAVRYCRTDRDCDRSLGQSCFRLYDGCFTGQCMCNPRLHNIDANGHCRRVKGGLESCARGELCQSGMHCQQGKCQCVTGRMTADGQYCLQPNESLLGQKCFSRNICLQLGPDGYTKNDATCSRNSRCECIEGFKTEGVSCKRWKIGEFGCKKTHHCTGGAVCVHDRCTCPFGYITTASNSKCSRYGAEIDIRLGASCDEINEYSYCARGLICHRCPEDTHHKCVRFLMASEFGYLGLTSGASQTLRQHLWFTLQLAVYAITNVFR